MVLWFLGQLSYKVALSTTEAEFVAASEGAKELVWFNRLLSEIDDKNDIPLLSLITPVQYG